MCRIQWTGRWEDVRRVHGVDARCRKRAVSKVQLDHVVSTSVRIGSRLIPR